MTDLSCPVEGCDYGEDTGKTLEQIRSHCNATSDDEHRWSELKQLVVSVVENDRDDEQQEAAREQPEASEITAGTTSKKQPDSGSHDDDELEAAREQAEAAESSEKQSNESGGSDPMPSDDEYTDQYEQGEATDEQEGEGGSETDEGWSLPMLESSTMMLLVGLLVVLVLVALLVSKESVSKESPVEQAEAVEKQENDQGDSAVSEEEVTLIE